MTRSSVRAVLGITLGSIAGLSTTSCELEQLIGPVDADEVTITLATSGGIVGVDYEIRVEGDSGEVRAVRCASGCEFSAGDLLLPVSDAQVMLLASALDAAGALQMGDRDFGTECCDQFHYDLTYERGDSSVRIQGTHARLPAELAAAVRLLQPLASRVLPLIVLQDSSLEDWPRDPYSLGEVSFDGSRIHADVSYGGGCADHRMDFVVFGGWMESFPVQVNALITHDGADDPCDSVVTETRAFDVFPLAVAYAQSYGSGGAERPRVILRIWDPATGELARTLEVQL
jgi:hypothetical protein